MICKAEVTNHKDSDGKIYLGLSETAFKERYNNYTKSFRNEASKKETEFPKYTLPLKDCNITSICK